MAQDLRYALRHLRRGPRIRRGHLEDVVREAERRGRVLGVNLPPPDSQPAPTGRQFLNRRALGSCLWALPPRCVALHVPRPRRPRPPDGDPSAFDGSPPSTRTRGRLGAARNAPGRSLHFGSRPPRAQYSVVKEHPAPTTRTGPETDRPQPTPGITPAAAPFLPRPWRRKRHAEGIDGSVEEVIPPRG
jgi:hypothetical protein